MKLFFVSSFLFAFFLVTHSRDDSERIVGGQVTTIDKVPYQVALYRYHSNLAECGGTIIHQYAVLTAAHCVQGLTVDEVTFSAGSGLNNRSGSIHRADWIVVHYDYDWTTLKNDIAFVKVVEPFALSSTEKPVNLPTAAPSGGTAALASGWGSDRGAQLRSSNISVVTLTSCQTKYSKFDLHPSTDMLCAAPNTGAVGPCQGDAGGPLVVQGALVGVFSWSGGCGDPLYPSVFANVFAFRQFIDENISYIRS